jgi:Ribosomal protein L7/L12 C-terminal domain
MNVILISHGSNKIGVVKAIEEITGKSLYESKQLAEKAPSVICQGLTEDAANLVKHKLELIGGTAVLATTTEATQQQSPAPPAATVRTLARERLLERPSAQEHAPESMFIEGGDDYLAIKLPARDHPTYQDALSLLKEHRFILEPSSRKWWLRDSNKVRAFLLSTKNLLQEVYNVQLSPNILSLCLGEQAALAELPQKDRLAIKLPANRASTDKNVELKYDSINYIVIGRVEGPEFITIDGVGKNALIFLHNVNTNRGYGIYGDKDFPTWVANDDSAEVLNRFVVEIFDEFKTLTGWDKISKNFLSELVRGSWYDNISDFEYENKNYEAAEANGSVDLSKYVGAVGIWILSREECSITYNQETNNVTVDGEKMDLNDVFERLFENDRQHGYVVKIKSI